MNCEWWYYQGHRLPRRLIKDLEQLGRESQQLSSPQWTPPMGTGVIGCARVQERKCWGLASLSCLDYLRVSVGSQKCIARHRLSLKSPFQESSEGIIGSVSQILICRAGPETGLSPCLWWFLALTILTWFPFKYILSERSLLDVPRTSSSQPLGEGRDSSLTLVPQVCLFNLVQANSGDLSSVSTLCKAPLGSEWYQDGTSTPHSLLCIF